MGSVTKERIGVMPFSKIGPSLTRQPSSLAMRSCSSSQMRSSGQLSSSSSAGTCR